MSKLSNIQLPEKWLFFSFIEDQLDHMYHRVIRLLIAIMTAF